MMTHILMSWFKESTERQKTSFLKETVENADLHKAVLKKTMTTHVKYYFVANLSHIYWLIPFNLKKKTCLWLSKIVKSNKYWSE